MKGRPPPGMSRACRRKLGPRTQRALSAAEKAGCDLQTRSGGHLAVMRDGRRLCSIGLTPKGGKLTDIRQAKTILDATGAQL